MKRRDLLAAGVAACAMPLARAAPLESGLVTIRWGSSLVAMSQQFIADCDARDQVIRKLLSCQTQWTDVSLVTDPTLDCRRL